MGWNNSSATSIIPPNRTRSNPRAQTSSEPDDFKRGIQDAQVTLQINIIMFIVHIISYLSSRQMFTWMGQQESLRISHIRSHTVYYDTRFLFPSTNLCIYNKEEHNNVKVIIWWTRINAYFSLREKNMSYSSLPGSTYIYKHTSITPVSINHKKQKQCIKPVL